VAVITLRIGELAARSGVSTRSLRYYEQQRLLHSERSRTGQRHYPKVAVDRVRLIQLLFAANLSSRTIADLLPCAGAKITPAEAQARLAAERERIDAQIAQLAAARAQLDEVIALIGKSMVGCDYEAAVNEVD
jgi:DNA-binding transcriptional MerR regulator